MRPSVSHGPSPADDPPTKPEGSLAGWREERLLRAGVGADLAAAIAADRALDLHAVIGLIKRGCPPELAARILAPFDHERNPC